MGSKMCMSGKRPQGDSQKGQPAVGLLKSKLLRQLLMLDVKRASAGKVLRHENNPSVFPLSRESLWAVIFPGNILKCESS